MSRIDTMPEGFAKLIGQQALGVGDVIGGRYRLVKSLGNGGMGQVLVAENVAIGMRVAVKLLKPELVANPEFRQRFQNEAQAVAAIEHPNVARFFDVVVGDPTFIVMEYVRGETLAERLKLGPLPRARAIEIAQRLCWGLDAAHTAGVVHRDLKPAIVLLAPDAEHGEVPKLIDFGLAKVAASLGDSLTRTGQIIGTPAYMSPEQINGGKVDARADVYALGCVLFEMLTGKTPFAGGQDDVQILYRQMHDPPPPLSKTLPDAPVELERLLQTALHKDPGHRFPSMRAMAAALTALMPTRGPAPPVAKRGRSARALLAWAVAATLLFLGTAGMGVVRWRAGRTVAPGKGLLVVTTQPPGARVTVDGKALEETTPAALRGIGPGPHEVSVEKAGFATVERHLAVSNDERQALDLVLPPTSRRVEVGTVPANATLYVDGHLVPGTTPLTVALTEQDFHELRVERAGYETATRALKPEDNEAVVTLTMQPERQPRGTIMVDSQDVAEVWLDGVSTGLNTPTLGFRVVEGEHLIELRAPSGEKSAAKKIKLVRGQTQRLTMSLQAVR
ncbi:MAG: serine/threonine protein kinase [Myxococcales bacterium]|nr:serine/threonine protein kinase [Myxococcales bacterium]